VLAMLSMAARAEDVPNSTVRVGAYFVFYHVSADDITGPYVPAGLNINVKDTQTLYLAYLRRLSTHFVAEVSAGIPPLTKTYGKGPALLGSVPFNGQVISTARWFAPTVSIQYVLFRRQRAVATVRRYRRQLHQVLRPTVDAGRQRRQWRSDQHHFRSRLGSPGPSD
jgi:hypothetical protein